MQYNVQCLSYRQQFPQARIEKITYGDIPIGRMITEIQQQAIRLVDIFILPEYRGRGFGTDLLSVLQDRATEFHLPIHLMVLMNNPAKQLYERCGFYVTGHTAPFIAMEWNNI